MNGNQKLLLLGLIFGGVLLVSWSQLKGLIAWCQLSRINSINVTLMHGLRPTNKLGPIRLNKEQQKRLVNTFDWTKVANVRMQGWCKEKLRFEIDGKFGKSKVSFCPDEEMISFTGIVKIIGNSPGSKETWLPWRKELFQDQKIPEISEHLTTATANTAPQGAQ